MDHITLKTGNNAELASAVGRLLTHAAQTVESTKRVPVRIDIMRTQNNVGYRMIYEKKGTENK